MRSLPAHIIAQPRGAPNSTVYDQGPTLSAEIPLERPVSLTATPQMALHYPYHFGPSQCPSCTPPKGRVRRTRPSIGSSPPQTKSPVTSFSRLLGWTRKAWSSWGTPAFPPSCGMASTGPWVPRCGSLRASTRRFVSSMIADLSPDRCRMPDDDCNRMSGNSQTSPPFSTVGARATLLDYSDHSKPCQWHTPQSPKFVYQKDRACRMDIWRVYRRLKSVAC